MKRLTLTLALMLQGFVPASFCCKRRRQVVKSDYKAASAVSQGRKDCQRLRDYAEAIKLFEELLSRNKWRLIKRRV